MSGYNTNTNTNNNWSSHNNNGRPHLAAPPHTLFQHNDDSGEETPNTIRKVEEAESSFVPFPKPDYDNYRNDSFYQPKTTTTTAPYPNIQNSQYHNVHHQPSYTTPINQNINENKKESTPPYPTIPVMPSHKIINDVDEDEDENDDDLDIEKDIVNHEQNSIASTETATSIGESFDKNIPELIMTEQTFGEDYLEPDIKFITKQYITTNKNLILESEIPSSIFQEYGIERSDHNKESQFMRYSAITCEVENFKHSKFTLRQNSFNLGRQTELLICITLFDETPDLIAKTYKGVVENIAHFCQLKDELVWGENGWKNIVVCFVADGRKKINERTLTFFSSLGVYQPGFAKAKIGENSVKAHLYEHTTHMTIQDVTSDNVVNYERSVVPVQLLLCIKEKNKKKINSHKWVFDAFANDLNANFVVLLDGGTQPASKSLYHLWKAMARDDRIGGCCGEIKADLGSHFRNLLNPLVAAQNFEYKISNILDKPTESVFGFISVLPGAFSAYRLEAVKNDINGNGPLHEYFKGEDLDKAGESGVFTKNMYLAEDRILCFELVAKRNSNWLLKYVKRATAKTDTPINISTLIKQRRRWLNGSFFASLHSITHFWRIWKTNHSIFRKIFLMIEFIYQAVQLVVSWFSIACFFLVFRIMTVSLEDYFGGASILAGVFLWFYVGVTVATFLLSFGNRPEGTAKVYFAMVIFYAMLISYTFFAAIFVSVKAVKDFEKEKSFLELALHNARFRDFCVSLLSTYVLYFAASFLSLDPWHMFTSFIQYLLISPSFINILNIYAFCNLHDLSWGNRDDSEDDEADKLKAIDAKTAGFSTSNIANYADQNFENELIVSLDAPLDQNEVDLAYQKQLKEAKELAKKDDDDFEYHFHHLLKIKKDRRDKETKQKDEYALVRTGVVFIWMSTNVALIAGVLSQNGFTKLSDIQKTYQKRSEIFLTVILWLVAILAAFRFLGCVTYLINMIGFHFADLRVRAQNRYELSHGGDRNINYDLPRRDFSDYSQQQPYQENYSYRPQNRYY